MGDEFRIETYRIFDVTAPSEYLALSAQNKENYKTILSLGIVNLSDGTLGQTLLWGMFPEGTVTGDALRNPDNRFILIEQVEEE